MALFQLLLRAGWMPAGTEYMHVCICEYWKRVYMVTPLSTSPGWLPALFQLPWVAVSLLPRVGEGLEGASNKLPSWAAWRQVANPLGSEAGRKGRSRRCTGRPGTRGAGPALRGLGLDSWGAL